MKDKKKVSRFEWSKDEGYPTPVTNMNLVCKDCEKRIDEDVVSTCQVFEIKPTAVLLGEECDEYVKQVKR